MKSQKVFWSSNLLLALLGLGACAQLATQQKQKEEPVATQEDGEQQRRATPRFE